MSVQNKALSENRLGLSWPLLVWLAGLLVLMVGDEMLRDADTYWHTAVGRWILLYRTIPQSDFFSHSMLGTEWTAHEWLSEVVFAIVHSFAGWSGLVVLITFCFTGTLALMTRYFLRFLEPVHALILAALAAGMVRSHLLARPHMLVAPILSIWLIGLLNARERDRAPSFLLLPLMILWANLHGSFTLGLGLVVAFGLEAAWSAGRSGWDLAAREWGGFFVLTLVAAMITPFHWHGLSFTVHVLTLKEAMAFIGEWSSPNFQAFNIFEIWLLALLAVGMAGRIKVPLMRSLLVLGFIHLSLRHGRYMAVTGVVGPLLVAESLGTRWYTAEKLGRDVEGVDRFFRSMVPPASPRAIGFGMLATALAVAAVVSFAPFESNRRISPASALSAIRSAGIEGPIFNAYEFGGFLIHYGIPVFIDGRADMYGGRFLGKYVDAINLKSDRSLTDLLDEYKIEATMLAPETPAVALLDNLPGWRRLHDDDTAVVHVRDSRAGRSSDDCQRPNWLTIPPCQARPTP